jgi:hypothetical protein
MFTVLDTANFFLVINEDNGSFVQISKRCHDCSHYVAHLLPNDEDYRQQIYHRSDILGLLSDIGYTEEHEYLDHFVGK